MVSQHRVFLVLIMMIDDADWFKQRLTMEIEGTELEENLDTYEGQCK